MPPRRPGAPGGARDRCWAGRGASSHARASCDAARRRRQSAVAIGETMSWLDSYRALGRYNRWMNERLYGLAAELGDEERKRDVGAFFGSLHGTLSHLVFADLVWLERFTNDPAVRQMFDEKG